MRVLMHRRLLKFALESDTVSTAGSAFSAKLKSSGARNFKAQTHRKATTARHERNEIDLSGEHPCAPARRPSLSELGHCNARKGFGGPIVQEP